MRNLIIAAFVALGLAGCAGDLTKVQAAYSVLTSATVPIKDVKVAGLTFDAIEVTATNYLRLRRCDGSNGPVCRDPVATAKIISAVRAGRVARNDLKQFLRDHPGALGPKGLYDALIQATTSLQGVIAQYKAG